MSETQALAALILLAILAGVFIVLYYGKSTERKTKACHTCKRYLIRSDAGAVVFETDEPEQAERARTWFRGTVEDTWQRQH